KLDPTVVRGSETNAPARTRVFLAFCPFLPDGRSVVGIAHEVDLRGFAVLERNHADPLAALAVFIIVEVSLDHRTRRLIGPEQLAQLLGRQRDHDAEIRLVADAVHVEDRASAVGIAGLACFLDRGGVGVVAVEPARAELPLLELIQRPLHVLVVRYEIAPGFGTHRWSPRSRISITAA